MRVVELTRAIADPQHVTGRAVPIAGGRILARHRLLEAEQESLVARIEVGRTQLGMALEIETAGLHECKRLRDAVGDLAIAIELLGILDKAEHPLMDAAKAGIAAVGKCAQQI